MSRAPRALALAVTTLAIALGGCGGGGAESDDQGGPPPARTIAPAPRPASPPAPRPAPPGPRRLTLGMNLSSMLSNLAAPPALVAATAADAGRAGFRVARSDALWEAAEPAAPGPDGRHVYDWRVNDQTATVLAQQGMEWWVVLAYAPSWAAVEGTRRFSPPRDLADYAAYARAFARRYGRDGDFWRAHPELDAPPVRTLEVWNEPDSGAFWAPTPQPDRYAELYRLTRRAIRAEDPSMRVFIGGLATGPAFLAGLKGHLRSDEIDGIAQHAYDPPSTVLERVREFRAAVRAAGLGDPPVALTEFGWQDAEPGKPDYAPDPERAQNFVSTVSALAASGCGAVEAFPFTWAALTPTEYTARYVVDDGASRVALTRLAAAPPPLAARDRARCP